MNTTIFDQVTLPIDFGKVLLLTEAFDIDKIITNPLKESLIVVNNNPLNQSIKEKNESLSLKYIISSVELAMPLARIIDSLSGMLKRVQKANSRGMKYIAVVFVSKEEFENNEEELTLIKNSGICNNIGDKISLIIAVG